MTKHRVIVADDVDVVRESLRLALERGGYEVVEAADGEEALAHLRDRGADAIVADLWMPRMDGVALLKAVRREAPAVKVIAISGGGAGMSLEVASSLAHAWGAEATLYKPFENTTLVARLDALLGQPRARRRGETCPVVPVTKPVASAGP